MHTWEMVSTATRLKPLSSHDALQARKRVAPSFSTVSGILHGLRHSDHVTMLYKLK